MYSSPSYRLSSHDIFHDFSAIEESNNSIQVIDGLEVDLCDIKMPQYDLLTIGNEKHQFLNEKEPYRYSKRIRELITTAYIDFTPCEDHVWVDFIAYHIKKHRGTGMARKLLETACEALWAPLPVRGTVPMITTGRVHWRRLLNWYKEIGFVEYKRTTNTIHPMVYIELNTENNNPSQ